MCQFLAIFFFSSTLGAIHPFSSLNHEPISNDSTRTIDEGPQVLEKNEVEILLHKGRRMVIIHTMISIVVTVVVYGCPTIDHV